MFITAQTIRRLIAELDPPLICFMGEGKWAMDAPVDREEYEQLREQQDALKTGRIEGSCYDLTLESIHQCERHKVPFLGRERRIIPTVENMPFVTKLATPETWLLESSTFYLLQSAETINMPPWLMGIAHMRTTEFRSGADVACSFVKPGYRGRITVGMTFPQGLIEIQKGFRFASIAFSHFESDWIAGELLQELKNKTNHDEPMTLEEISAETDPYTGIWSGTKITTDGLEERGY